MPAKYTTDLIRISEGADVMRLGAFMLTPIGMRVSGRPTIDQWQQCGKVLHRMEGAVQFWIGDWVNYGERSYGEKYTAAVEATDLDRQTIENYAYVCRSIEFSRRRENLPYSVHLEVAHLASEVQEKILARASREELTVRAVRDLVRAEVHAGKIEAIARGQLPAGEYDVVCADPPWAYDNSGFDQSAANHYPTMTVDAIAALPLTDLTFPRFADPCVLFLWGTSPLVPAALAVLAAWGFEYRTCLVWVKDRAPGLGWWLQTRHELLLVGVRGSVTPLERVDSVITAAVSEHSRKPIAAYDAIDRMFPGVRRVECFARTARDGWAVWGNEV